MQDFFYLSGCEYTLNVSETYTIFTNMPGTNFAFLTVKILLIISGATFWAQHYLVVAQATQV